MLWPVPVALLVRPREGTAVTLSVRTPDEGPGRGSAAPRSNRRHRAVDVESVLRLLSDHAASELTVSSLARRIGCSREHLSRTFRAMYGRTIRQALVDARLRMTRDLASQGVKVAAACHEAGWRSTASFYRWLARSRAAGGSASLPAAHDARIEPIS
jgi:transcriptional regulator GlxA family with amidase domain